VKITSVQTFGKPTIRDYYCSAKKQVVEEVESYPPQDLIGSDTNELTEYFFQKASLSPLIIDDDREIEVGKVIKREEFQTMLGDIGHRDVTQAKITIPLKPGSSIKESLQYFTQTHSVEVYEYDFDESAFTVSLITPPEDIEGAINKHKTIFEQRTAEINSNNDELKILIKEAIEKRKEKIKEDDDSFEAMVQKVSIPLRRKSSPADYEVPLKIREQIKQMSAPKTTPPEELILSEEQLKSIIEVIDSDGRNFENTPETFSQLREQDLRNVILTHLNFYFPDDATGETFVGVGKADIRLKVFEGQILLAECKYWHGEEELKKAINQLFGYLTWRHNYGIIIIFSKNQDFSDVLDKAKSAIQSHETYRDNLKERSVTHFSSTHLFPKDTKKEVDVHTLIYNLSHGK